MIHLNTKNIVVLILYALPNTLLSFGIVYIINNVLAGNEDFLKSYMSIVFLALVVYTYLLNIVFQKALNKFSFELLYENEKKIFSQILEASLLKFEKFGPQRFFTTIEDLRTFAMLPHTVTHTINSLLMLLLCLGYMFTLSFVSAIIVIGLIILVAASYFIVMNSMSKKVERLREYNVEYYKYVDDVINGFKELKLSFFRRNSLMNKFLAPNRDLARDLDYEVNYVFLSINLISQYGLYLVVAVILFVLPALGFLNQGEVISYVVIILFISGPINNLINLQQMYTRFFVADQRIKGFTRDFEIDEKESIVVGEDHFVFDKLKFDNVSFAYQHKNQDTKSFMLGPVNVEINQGETIFIVGGNGSGKSTFVNLLTGLYKPTSGNICLNNEPEEHMREKLQSMLAAVFTDNHLFSCNYDNYELEKNSIYQQLLKMMQLDEIVVDDKDESIRRKFSKGQSKRMSLIFALLEKKPILVLDEWAADQDPHFRKYFYENILPWLKKQGTTVIAVTHDDHYFKFADRILKFDYGHIVKDYRTDDKEMSPKAIWFNR